MAYAMKRKSSPGAMMPALTCLVPTKRASPTAAARTTWTSSEERAMSLVVLTSFLALEELIFSSSRPRSPEARAS